MVIICPMGMEGRLALTLLPVCTFIAFLSSPKSSSLCSSQIVHSVALLLVHFLNTVPRLIPLYLGVFLLRASSFGFWSLLVYLVLLLGSFYASNSECAIQNLELGIAAPCKTSEESELPQPGPHGGEILEQRDSFAGQ